MSTVRINLEVPKEYRNRLKALQASTDSTTQSEVFRKAIALLEIVTKISADGGKLSAIYPEGTTDTLVFIGITKTPT